LGMSLVLSCLSGFWLSAKHWEFCSKFGCLSMRLFLYCIFLRITVGCLSSVLYTPSYAYELSVREGRVCRYLFTYIGILSVLSVRSSVNTMSRLRRRDVLHRSVEEISGRNCRARFFHTFARNLSPALSI
jgi:hypothetical protein